MSFNSNSEISFVYGNMLRVNKKKLWADVLHVPDEKKLEVVTPDEFETILAMGAQAIRDVHCQFPEIWGIRLSTDADTHGRESSRVYTPKGHDKRNSDPGLVEKDDIVEDFHPYWEVVEDANFTPKVMGVGGKVDGGAWLMLGR